MLIRQLTRGSIITVTAVRLVCNISVPIGAALILKVHEHQRFQSYDQFNLTSHSRIIGQRNFCSRPQGVVLIRGKAIAREFTDCELSHLILNALCSRSSWCFLMRHHILGNIILKNCTVGIQDRRGCMGEVSDNLDRTILKDVRMNLLIVSGRIQGQRTIVKCSYTLPTACNRHVYIFPAGSTTGHPSRIKVAFNL